MLVYVLTYKNGKFTTHKRFLNNILNDRKPFEKSFGYSIIVNPTYPRDKDLEKVKKALIKAENGTIKDFIEFVDKRKKYEITY